MFFVEASVPARPHSSAKIRGTDALHETPPGLSFQRLAENNDAKRRDSETLHETLETGRDGDTLCVAPAS